MQAVEDQNEEAELNRLVETEPHSLDAHVRLGDLAARQDKPRLARFYYRKALDLAATRDLSEEDAAEVRRAGAALAEIEGFAHSEREAVLVERGHPPDQWSPRFRQAIEIAAGRRKPYVQEPTEFNFPGLPAIQ